MKFFFDSRKPNKQFLKFKYNQSWVIYISKYNLSSSCKYYYLCNRRVLRECCNCSWLDGKAAMDDPHMKMDFKMVYYFYIQDF